LSYNIKTNIRTNHVRGYVNVFQKSAQRVFGTEGLLSNTWLVTFQWDALCRVQLGLSLA